MPVASTQDDSGYRCNSNGREPLSRGMNGFDSHRRYVVAGQRADDNPNQFITHQLHDWLHDQLVFRLEWLHHHHSSDDWVWHAHEHLAYEPHKHPEDHLEWDIHDHGEVYPV